MTSIPNLRALGVATGDSPLPIYDSMAQLKSWSPALTVFALDEYIWAATLTLRSPHPRFIVTMKRLSCRIRCGVPPERSRARCPRPAALIHPRCKTTMPQSADQHIGVRDRIRTECQPPGAHAIDP